MVVEETDTDLTTHMVTTLLVLAIGEVLNHQVTNRITMLTDISLIVHGEQVVMERSMVIEVHEVVKD